MIGKNIKSIRIKKKLTQKQLAEKVGVSVKTISHWENGYSAPNISGITKLKKSLGVSYDELFEKK